MTTTIATQLLAQSPPWADWPGEYGPGPWPFGLVFLVLFAGLIATVVWLVVRATRTRSPADRAKDILAERYARGEISSDEYRERTNELR